MRDFKFSTGHRFSDAVNEGPALRKRRAEAHSDRVMRGEEKPKTGMEGMPEPERGGSAGNRAGKHPPIKGKVKRIEIEPAHGGHILHIQYHPRKAGKGKRGEPMPMHYVEPEKHVHATRDGMMNHMNAALDQMEPEEPDSDDLAQSL